MGRNLEVILPAFKWLSVPGLSLGLAESFLYGIYPSLAFVPIYTLSPVAGKPRARGGLSLVADQNALMAASAPLYRGRIIVSLGFAASAAMDLHRAAPSRLTRINAAYARRGDYRVGDLFALQV